MKQRPPKLKSKSRPRTPAKRKPKPEVGERPASRFAPSAFLSGSAASVQELCDELAGLAAERFADLTGTTWQQVASSLVQQLRAAGHDLGSFDEGDGFQEWQATWHHPRGSFSLFLAFRTPSKVEVSWRTDDAEFVGRAG